MTLDASQAKLYVAQDNADQVAVIDTSNNKVVAKIDARAPLGSCRRRNTPVRRRLR
jgi:YVTN family beta-propeller protein